MQQRPSGYADPSLPTGRGQVQRRGLITHPYSGVVYAAPFQTYVQAGQSALSRTYLPAAGSPLINTNQARGIFDLTFLTTAASTNEFFIHAGFGTAGNGFRIGRQTTGLLQIQAGNSIPLIVTGTTYTAGDRLQVLFTLNSGNATVGYDGCILEMYKNGVLTGPPSSVPPGSFDPQGILFLTGNAGAPLELSYGAPTTTFATQTTYSRSAIASFRWWMNKNSACYPINFTSAGLKTFEISATVTNNATVPLINTYRMVVGVSSVFHNELTSTLTAAAGTSSTQIVFPQTVEIRIDLPSQQQVSWGTGPTAGTGVWNTSGVGTTFLITINTGVAPTPGVLVTFVNCRVNVVSFTLTSCTLDVPVTVNLTGGSESVGQQVPDGPNLAAALALPTDNIGAIAGIVPDLYMGGSMSLAQWNAGVQLGSIATPLWSGGTAGGTPFTAYP